MSSKVALSYGKTGRRRPEEVGMIKTSKCRVRWKEGALNPDDKWVVVSLHFYDADQKLIVPKKAISSGGRGPPNSHDLAIFVPKDSQAIYHFPHEWNGHRAGNEMFLGAIFRSSLRVATIKIVHEHEPVGANGEHKTLTVEYWDVNQWKEYVDDKWKPELIYTNGISAFREKREREKMDYMQLNLDANSLLKDTVEPCESKVDYFLNTDDLPPTDKWRVRCLDTSDWTWDVKALRFVDDDGRLIYPSRAIKSGNYNSLYSANAAVSGKPYKYCWGGKMDPETRSFFIGGQFSSPVSLSSIEVVQPFGDHRRNSLIVEYWHMEKKEWLNVARYDFYDSLIKRGPVSLCILSSEPIVLTDKNEDKYRIGDDPDIDSMQLELDDLKKELDESLMKDDKSNEKINLEIEKFENEMKEMRQNNENMIESVQ